YHSHSAPLPSEERRAVQRQHGPHRVLQRPRTGRQRRSLDRRDDDRPGPAVPHRTILHEHAFQEAVRWVQLASHAVPCALTDRDNGGDGVNGITQRRRETEISYILLVQPSPLLRFSVLCR